MYIMLFLIMAMIDSHQIQKNIINTWVLVSYKSNNDFKGWLQVDLEIIDIVSRNSIVIKKKSSKNLERLQFKFENDSLNLNGDKYDIFLDKDRLVLTNSYHILNFVAIKKNVSEISRETLVDSFLNKSFTLNEGVKTKISFYNQELTSFYFGEEFKPGKKMAHDKSVDFGWSVFKYDCYAFLKIIMDSTFNEVYYQILNLDDNNINALRLDDGSIVKFRPI